MATDAKPYKEGDTWSMRRRIYGQELFESGHKTAAAAKKAMEKRVMPLKERGKPKGAGPHHTTVAQAAQDYAMERLRFLKGAVQEANADQRRSSSVASSAGWRSVPAVSASSSVTTGYRHSSGSSRHRSYSSRQRPTSAPGQWLATWAKSSTELAEPALQVAVARRTGIDDEALDPFGKTLLMALRFGERGAGHCRAQVQHGANGLMRRFDEGVQVAAPRVVVLLMVRGGL